MYSSSASIQSFQSSTTPGRRMIIPLYNLQAHNVMTNTVVDAGTDAKVAKFQKRGLEIIGLAVLEPIELWGEAPAVLASSARTSMDGGHDGGNGSTTSNREKEFSRISPAPTPTSRTSDRPMSASSFSRLSNHRDPVPQSAGAAKKMFGKIFRKSNNRQPPISLPGEPTVSHRNSFSLAPGNQDRSPAPPVAATASTLSTASETTNTTRPLVLGIQPSMSAPSYPPHGRPDKYVWVVRRWIKGADSGLLGGMMVRLNSNGKEHFGIGAGMAMINGMGQVEVQFEWTRGKSGVTRKRGRPAPNTDGSVNRRASLIISSQSSKEHLQAGSLSMKDKRASSISQRSMSTHTGTSDDHHEQSSIYHQEDEGDESDPEDSETPWTCAVNVQRIARPGTATALSSSGHSTVQEQALRLKVATLSPTPHHPKVVSMLKVPFPLPDIEIDKVVMRKRVLTPQGIARPGTSAGPEGLLLTAEEIKDVVSCTGLWLVVREGFGGIGKVSRKGDGWKIRG